MNTYWACYTLSRNEYTSAYVHLACVHNLHLIRLMLCVLDSLLFVVACARVLPLLIYSVRYSLGQLAWLVSIAFLSMVCATHTCMCNWCPHTYGHIIGVNDIMNIYVCLPIYIYIYSLPPVGNAPPDSKQQFSGEYRARNYD